MTGLEWSVEMVGLASAVARVQAEPEGRLEREPKLHRKSIHSQHARSMWGLI
jgi:hypothetical protein